MRPEPTALRPAGVTAWEERVTIPTYAAAMPDRNPMFLEKRIYQGSSGKVYPLPFTDRVSQVKEDREWQAVFIENEYLKVMILPEIGGRIHIGFDKIAEYDFFYRQDVIKPALVGLAGPWISGGVEFNWPQHHRPTTYMPVDYVVESEADGACVVWLSEHEPMQRMKGMAGICLRPGKGFIEIRARLYNCTPLPQTFLWWTNAGIRVHDQYQAFFPPDVHFVADHAKRAISSYPIARNFYYGVDYTGGVDISWYKNIPVPTSYMAPKSEYGFLGGYDHAKGAGVVHYADPNLVPGKKLWTWGNAEFGYSWDRNLTDDGGPYIELMAGAFTDNQPDFSWIAPLETRTFQQYWYPIHEIGPAKNANRDAAINLEIRSGRALVGVCVTGIHTGARVVLTDGSQVVLDRLVDLSPETPFRATCEVNSDPARLFLRVVDASDRDIIQWLPETAQADSVPQPAKAPRKPSEISSNDELLLTGLHLEQYRHATRSPEPYWQEALARDPLDSRAHAALGLRCLRRGEFTAAEVHLTDSIGRATERNPNPYDGEAFYHLGVTLRYQGKLHQARSAFLKAVWNAAWSGPAHYALATIAAAQGDYGAALEHLELALESGASNLKARGLKCAMLRRLGRAGEAEALARRTLEIDPLDWWARAELQATERHVSSADAQVSLDIAFDYAEAGLLPEAATVLERCGQGHPMVLYALAHFAQLQGDPAGASAFRKRARDASPDYCFPARLEELHILQASLTAEPGDSRAHYYLGNLLYDKQRYEPAITHWEAACRLEPEFSIPWRNLGIAYYNVRRDAPRALECYRAAFAANSTDARLLYEIDQLRKRMGVQPRERLAELERHPDLLHLRDDLMAERIALYNLLGQPERALELLNARHFQPWEGGEGLISGQYVAAHLTLGCEALEHGRTAVALQHFEAARHYPENLGEGKHLLTPEAELEWFTALAHLADGDRESAVAHWRKAATANANDSPASYYGALAQAQMGDEQASRSLLCGMLDAAEHRKNQKAEIDYFATSLPNFLLFDDDLDERQRMDCLYLEGLARQGLGETERAAKVFEQLLAMDPSFAPAAAQLARSEQALKGTRQ